jgi:hypothetical protein
VAGDFEEVGEGGAGVALGFVAVEVELREGGVVGLDWVCVGFSGKMLMGRVVLLYRRCRVGWRQVESWRVPTHDDEAVMNGARGGDWGGESPSVACRPASANDNPPFR